MVPRHPFLVLGVGIYEHRLTSEGLVLLELAELHFDSEQRPASFEKGAMKEEVLSQSSRNDV